MNRRQLAAILLAGVCWASPSLANAKTVLICTPDKSRCMTITLPAAGKCSKRTIRGYSVKVCR